MTVTEPASGVDLTAVGRWMDGQGLPPGDFDTVSELSGGTQNVMLRLVRGGRRYVLRRPPLHLRPRSNDALLREMRVLEALRTTPVPAPGMVAACRDPDVLGGAVFYLMDDIDGFNATVTLPRRHERDAAIRREMGLNAARAAAALSRVDPAEVGLADLGTADGFHARQVPRWLAELKGYSELAGYPGPDIPGIDIVAGWLAGHLPTTWQPGLIHGDFHLANLLYSPSGPQVAAVVDWEMATVGDPLLDLGWLLATWPSAAGDGPFRASSIARAGGLPGADEVVACYAEHSGRDVTSVAWYHVLACFKLGILLEGTHARACAGRAPRPVGDRLHAHARGLFTQALSLL